MSSSSTEEFDVINKPDHIIQQESSNEKFSIHDKSPYEYPHVLYIDEDDERSVSLKSSISDSKTPSYTISIKINRLQTLSISSSLSSSSNVSNDFYTNQRKFHESSV